MKRRCSKVLAIVLFTVLLFAESGCLQSMGNKPEESGKSTAIESPGGNSRQTGTPSLSDTSSSEKTGKTAKPSRSAKPSPPEDEEEDFAKLAPTTVMSFEELVGDNGDYKPVKDYPPAGTYKLVVNIYYQFITAYKKDADGHYSIPVRYMICSSGSPKKPTPTGKFKLGKERHRFSKFVTYNVYGQYWTQITRNIYFHSLLYTEKDASTYTNSSYQNLGKRVSHGCVRMLVPDARWIYYNAAPGTVVEIIRGKKDEKLAEIKKKLTRAKLPSKRPDLKKGKIPVTEAWPGYKGPVASAEK